MKNTLYASKSLAQAFANCFAVLVFITVGYKVASDDILSALHLSCTKNKLDKVN